jgi:type II secretion system protein G
MQQEKFCSRLNLSRGLRNRLGIRRGFTLIELLIVIAIILILIAIALPNFLEAQIRARVTKARGEIRTLATALESYAIDFRIYPGRSSPDWANRRRDEVGLTWLTSPIAYITSMPDDPFPTTYDINDPSQERDGPWSYLMTGVDTEPLGELYDYRPLHPHGGGFLRMYVLFSAGPDHPRLEVDPEGGNCATSGGPYASYTPTNGTKSRGDLWLWGGESHWMGLEIGGRGCLGLHQYLKEPSRAVGVNVDGQILFKRFPAGSTL